MQVCKWNIFTAVISCELSGLEQNYNIYTVCLEQSIHDNMLKMSLADPTICSFKN